MERPSLSVIIPTLNEEEQIGRLLIQLREQAPDAEILVADGGSHDGTAGRAEAWATVVDCPRGRAVQMNAAARQAEGDILWFLHADSLLPDGAASAVRCAMSDARFAGGCFRLAIPARGLAYRVCDVWGNLGADLFRLACGDHGIFIRRAAFESIGGYPAVPLMEDVELYRAMRRRGRVRQLRPAITTSPRRWQQHGPWKVTGSYLLIWSLYLAGFRMDALTRVYRSISRSGRAGSPNDPFTV